MTTTARAKPRNRQDIFERYPIILGHLICESLGYFTPGAAANALLSYIRWEPFVCEWYTHMGGMYKGEWPNDQKLLEVGRQVVERTVRGRHRHAGYMAHYPQARALVEHVRSGGKGPELASWF